MNNYDETSKESILNHARKLLGQSLRGLYPNVKPYTKKGTGSGKGALGQTVEFYHFGYEPNSDPEPDFKEVGAELKCTPLKLLCDGSMVSKERLVLTIIDYEKEAGVDFEQSSFWHKSRLMLLMFYLHDVVEAVVHKDIVVNQRFHPPSYRHALVVANPRPHRRHIVLHPQLVEPLRSSYLALIGDTQNIPCYGIFLYTIHL